MCPQNFPRSSCFTRQYHTPPLFSPTRRRLWSNLYTFSKLKICYRYCFTIWMFWCLFLLSADFQRKLTRFESTPDMIATIVGTLRKVCWQLNNHYFVLASGTLVKPEFHKFFLQCFKIFYFKSLSWRKIGTLKFPVEI